MYSNYYFSGNVLDFPEFCCDECGQAAKRQLFEMSDGYNTSYLCRVCRSRAEHDARQNNSPRQERILNLCELFA